MSTSNDSGVFLTVRGKYLASTLESCRIIHNDTAGSAPGIAAARALGDLSHKVYAPLPSPNSSAKDGEVLFFDWWQDAKGLMDFFANENVQMQGTKLFSSRDATVWMPARGSFSYTLPAAAGKNERYVGMVRGPIASPEAAIATIWRTMIPPIESVTKSIGPPPSGKHTLTSGATCSAARMSNGW